MRLLYSDSDILSRCPLIINKIDMSSPKHQDGNILSEEYTGTANSSTRLLTQHPARLGALFHACTPACRTKERPILLSVSPLIFDLLPSPSEHLRLVAMFDQLIAVCKRFDDRLETYTKSKRKFEAALQELAPFDEASARAGLQKWTSALKDAEALEKNEGLSKDIRERLGVLVTVMRELGELDHTGNNEANRP